MIQQQEYGPIDSGRLMSGNTSNPNVVYIMQSLREKGMLVPDSDLGPEVRSEYRRIKRPLLSNAFGKSASLVDQGNLIMVTSAVPGEGKTYTAINLALAIAQERDSTVLLVDCDVTKQGSAGCWVSRNAGPISSTCWPVTACRSSDALIKDRRAGPGDFAGRKATRIHHGNDRQQANGDPDG